MKQFLFVIRMSEQHSQQTQEGLDRILTVAAFDQSVNVLYLDDGVYRLSTSQPESLASLAAFELYDIRNVWVERESLLSRELDEACLPISVQVLARREVADLWSLHDVVLEAG